MIKNEYSKVVFITGCSSGIGRSCAIRFAQEGYRVVATARNPEAIREFEAFNEKFSGEIKTCACDVTSEESMLAAIEFARETFGSVDILVNNAGFGLFGPVEMLQIETARHQLEVNTFGPMRLVQLVVGDMRKSGWGRIINVSSVAGRLYVPMGGWYSASKHAMEALTDALRVELQAFGIHAVSIMPGPVETDFISNVQTPVKDSENAPNVYKQIGEAIRKRNSGHRHASVTADRVAEIVVKAASVRKPKTRYLMTAHDKIGLFLMQLMSDRAWDKLIASAYHFRDAIKPRKEKSVV